MTDKPRRSAGMRGSPVNPAPEHRPVSTVPKARPEVEQPERVSTSPYAKPKILMGEVAAPKGQLIAVGRDAFRTATGVHAAAIIKAMNKGDAWLADRIYSGVPAGMFGRKQEIVIGFMSGASNVNYYRRERGIEPDELLVSELLKEAKAGSHILTDAEVSAVVSRVRGRSA